MISEIKIEDAIASHLPIVDVRSPGEFEHGHIPSAINIPLFSNDERAHIGTIYKQKSKEKAVEVGYTYVLPKLEQFISDALKVAPDKKIIVHCWRGGMRSKSFAQHLDENGFHDVKVIIGGYKSFRNLVLNNLAKSVDLKVLGGYTGSGKTVILHELKKLGNQIIDLEGLAIHKGSAFGGIGQKEQPTVEQFENNLHAECRKLNLSKPIWIEDESHNIGKVKIPMQLFNQIRSAKLFFMDIPKSERAKFLVSEYANIDTQYLKGSIHRISKRLGDLNTKKAIQLLDEGKFYEVALISLHYYDKYYLKGMQKRNQNEVIKIKFSSTDHYKNALIIEKTANNMKNIKLTQYSHGAGCGCKISPKVLSTILKTNITPVNDVRLLVGNDSRDDAAVYDLGDGTAIISTTDFFMPIVDDPFTFGKIAATNAISDIYAMGGDPVLAIAILGWPIDKLAPEIAQKVLEGGRQTCKEAGIALAGGHSIDSPEPIFGLAVTGRVDLNKIKRNDTATEGCQLYLTKPLGIGAFTTAQKRGLLLPEHEYIAPASMSKLNKIGQEMASINGVKAMTDVTGFGLIGHLTEMCEGSDLSAIIEMEKIPVFKEAYTYIEQKCIPGGSKTNWESYGKNVQLNSEEEKWILCDPQTSGGLLIAVENDSAKEVENLLKSNKIDAVPFGILQKRSDILIKVI